MPLKKKTIIRAIIAFLLFIAVARLAWILLPPPVVCVNKVQSPDKRFTAKALNIWYNDYWGRAPHENHYFSIQTTDGRTIQHVHAEKPWTGWPHDCGIQWTTNSSSVTFTFDTNTAFSPHLVLYINPSD